MNLKLRYTRDRVVESLLILLTVLVVLPLLIIIGFVVVNGLGSLNWEFFTEELGSPSRAAEGTPSGLVAAIVGTFIIDFLGLALALPFGLAAGILMSEYPDHPLVPYTRILVSAFNGMPAVLMGLLAYVLVVKNTGGFSAISGSVALAFLMIPIIARSTESMLRITPWTLREAGLSLGLPRWRVTLNIVLPAARVGVMTGILISFARAAGEAAPMLLTAFGNNYLSFDLFQPMDSLPQRLYSLAISPYRHWHTLGWGGAIVLFLFVLGTFAMARFVVYRMERKAEEIEIRQISEAEEETK